MIKVNDRVYHVYDMGLRGVVVGVVQERAKAWMVGGSSQGRMIANIQKQSGEVVSVPVADLMRED